MEKEDISYPCITDPVRHWGMLGKRGGTRLATWVFNWMNEERMKVDGWVTDVCENARYFRSSGRWPSAQGGESRIDLVPDAGRALLEKETERKGTYVTIQRNPVRIPQPL